MPSQETRLARFIAFILRHPWAVLVASLVFAGWAGSGAKNLALANDYRVFFSAENPDLLDFEKIEATYTKNDNVIFVIQPDEGTVFNTKTLGAIRTANEEEHRADALPHSKHLAFGDIQRLRRHRAGGRHGRARRAKPQADDNRCRNRQNADHEDDHQRHYQTPQPAQAGGFFFVFLGVTHGLS